MRALTDRQQRVLAFMRSESAAGRPLPSARAIATHMGWKNANGAADACMALAAKGHLRIVSREPSSRGWRYVWQLVEAA